MSRFYKKHQKKIITIGSLILFLYVMFYQGIVIRRYSVETEKIADGKSFCLAVVTDLHSYTYGKDQSPLLDRILRENPDAVLLVGDIYDNVTSPEGVRLLLAGLRNRIPMYYVTGNHEYWTRDIPAVLELFAQYGVTILDDRWRSVVLGEVPVILAGVSDPVRPAYEQGYDVFTAMKKAFAAMPSEQYTILLAHRPTWFHHYHAYPFDLVVSGHNHGGQVRIPFLLNGLYGPDEGFLPEFPGGRYEIDNTTLIVSRGLSINARLPRVWNPPELVFVTVSGKSKI